jgi:hypothetical protein
METTKQLELVRDFMIAVAPEVTRHHLSQLRHQQLNPDLDDEGMTQYSGLAETGARLTLELAMHLAAKYSQAYDSITE